MNGPAQPYIDRQLQREAAFRLLVPFAGGVGQAWLPAWVGLLGELDESMFELSDPRVARAKLAWWGQDLAAGAGAQHPLSRRLLGAAVAAGIEAAAWTRLAQACTAMTLVEPAPADWAGADACWLELARAVAAVEGGLLGQPVDPGLVAVQAQRQRMWRASLRDAPEQGLAPPSWADAVRDRSRVAAAWREWAQAHGEALARESAARLPLHRALLRTVWQWRLSVLLRGADPARAIAPPALVLLWRSWRAARRAAAAADTGRSPVPS